jgi:transcriptional regulator with XRE-family HTH domain
MPTHVRVGAPTVKLVGARRSEFGEFLRSRRNAITPAQAGMEPFPGPRRVAGLRREEVAMLAGLSADYYSRLEQGRQAGVSEQVLRGLARALRLDEVETEHLRDLAGVSPTRPAAPVRPQRADPGLLRVMTALDRVPALLLGQRSEVLATNALLEAVLGARFEPGTPFGSWLLTEPAARTRIVNWTTFAEHSVAALRRETARHPEDARLRRMIAELRLDPDVDRWWRDHRVRDYASTTKRIAHPQAGELDFGVEHVTAPLDPDQHLVIYTVQPDSRTADVLPLLAGWIADTSDRVHT